MERAFGVMKKRFAVLRTPLEIGTFKDMWMVYYTCVALHNFIREEKGTSVIDEEFEAEVDREMQTQPVKEILYCTDTEEEQHVNWRDELAQDMWDEYQHYVHANNV